MQKLFMPVFFSSILFGFVISGENLNHQKDHDSKAADVYVCLPCGSDCDVTEYASGGTCSHCNMGLVKKSTIKHTNVNPKDLCSFIANAGSGDVLLLDVRTAAEFEGKAEDKFGRLRNAVNIPIQQLESRIKELAAYKNKQIVVYCSHSHRSPRASYMLTQKGFEKVTNMQGGMSVWTDSVKDKDCNDKLFVKQ